MMKLGISIAAAGAAAALVLPAVAASAQGGTHTLQFVSVQGKSVMLSQASGGQQDTDVNAAGKTVGFDMLYFLFTAGSTGAVSAAIETTGGFLYATFTFHAKTNTITNGKVTGGTGAFAGATGTITTRNLNAAGTRTAVTVTYRG
jgi:acyl-coenzyme A synthetase/AMP-(fatty) acid ligase